MAGPISDILSDEVFVSLCEFLPPLSIMSMNITCQSIHVQIAESTWLWRNLTTSFLGKTLIESHRAAWKEPNDSAQFFRRLFFQGLSCKEFVYSNDLRSQCLESLNSSLPAPSLEDLFSSSGHTATCIGSEIVIIGGWRRAHLDNLFLAIVDIKTKEVVQPQLSETSAKPPQRLRHSSCVIAMPSWFKQSSTTHSIKTDQNECVLVIGGRHPTHVTHDIGGVHDCLLLDTTGSNMATWHKLQMTGNAPLNIWHHSISSFSLGKKVICFGGDIPHNDPEYEFIAIRDGAAHVYILDIELKTWFRVSTSGDIPSWRSLHVGECYRSVVDNHERFIIVGGCDDHLSVFESGSTADFFGYSLDLETMVWCSSPNKNEIETPSPRMRFAAEVYGRYLIVFGGHDSLEPMIYGEQTMKLDLVSLTWSPVTVLNAAHSFRHSISSQLSGGLLTGGISPETMGPCPKFDILLLKDPLDTSITGGLPDTASP